MLARIAWRTLPDAVGGYAGAARYPALARHRAVARRGRARAAQLGAVRVRRSSRRRGAGALPASAGAARRRRAAQLVRRSRASPACAICARWPTTTMARRARPTDGAYRLRLRPWTSSSRSSRCWRSSIRSACCRSSSTSPKASAASSAAGRSASRRSAPSSSSRSAPSLGLRIIEFFGISLASFQVGGGMLLLLSSLQMLNAQPAESRTSDLARGQRQGRCRRLDRDRAAHDPAAHRPGDDLDDGDLRREDAPLVGDRRPRRLRRRHRAWRSGSRSAWPAGSRASSARPAST